MRKKTIIDLFEESVERFPDNPFLWEKRDGAFRSTSYSKVRERVYELGAGLVALGVRKGDNMALLSEGRDAWIIGELAMFYAGATNVPLSIKLEEANDLLFRLNHAEVRFIMVSSQQLGKIRAIKDSLPALERIIIFDGIDLYRDGEIALSEVIGMGRDLLASKGSDEFLALGRSIDGDDIATITYTSGTTADPKGVMLTHRNYTANVEQALSCVDIDDTWRTLVILPLDHCFAHVVGFYIFMSKGASVGTVQVGRTPMETLRNIPTNIKEFKPHLILSVPALAKNFKKSIEQGIRAKGKMAERLFKLALATGYIYNGSSDRDKGKGFRMLLKPLVSLFDNILFSKVRENFGGSLRFFIGGGALLDRDLQRFYYALGIPMYQGYGLSEATPVISTNGPRRHEFGSSGVLVRPLDLKICDSDGKSLPEGEKGEIVIRGENVMAGYWKNPVSTADTVRDGWLHTGDMGFMRGDLLFVLGRFKSLLIGSDGEKYSPEGIEEALVEHSSSIEQLILYNNQSAYTTALLVPNKDALRHQLSRQNLDLTSDEGREEAIRIIERQIARFKRGGDLASMFPERWLPATFAILPEPFSERNGMVNSTMKIVRGRVEKVYAKRIEHLYTAEGKNPMNALNKSSLE